jgi:hypothetical protein
MRRSLVGLLLALLMGTLVAAEERRNLSVEDVIAGFEAKRLTYYEVVLLNGKYYRTFNRCLASRPAEPEWILRHCKKNPEFKAAFQCSDDGGARLHVWFIYERENAAKCEEVRGAMKERMDALRE